jgi:hypothetical protein
LTKPPTRSNGYVLLAMRYLIASMTGTMEHPMTLMLKQSKRGRRFFVDDDIVTTNDNISQMSSNADDIVTRLRNSCAHLCDQCERENAYGVGDEAADEIERLRAAGDALAERLRWWTDDTDEAYPDHRVLQTWKETRRG